MKVLCVMLTVPSFSPPKSKRQRKYRSIISEVFDGTIVSSVQCLTCDRVSDLHVLHLNMHPITFAPLILIRRTSSVRFLSQRRITHGVLNTSDKPIYYVPVAGVEYAASDTWLSLWIKLQILYFVPMSNKQIKNSVLVYLFNHQI